MKKHYYIVEIGRITVEDTEGRVILDEKVLKIVRECNTRKEAEEIVRRWNESRDVYGDFRLFLLELEG